MSAVRFQDYVDDRADVLAANNLNGLKLILVTLPAGADPDHKDLAVSFYNGLHVNAIVAEISANPARSGVRSHGK